jgi:holo-[acyl-carrier protein] synthase
MVVGLGIDLVERGRISRMLERWGDRLVHHLMDPEEARRLSEAPVERAEQLAFAIAAKEAASKALGTGWSRGVRWQDVDVWLGPLPTLLLRNRAGDIARHLGSDGTTRIRFESRNDLLLSSVLLLSGSR